MPDSKLQSLHKNTSGCLSQLPDGAILPWSNLLRRSRKRSARCPTERGAVRDINYAPATRPKLSLTLRAASAFVLALTERAVGAKLPPLRWKRRRTHRDEYKKEESGKEKDLPCHWIPQHSDTPRRAAYSCPGRFRLSKKSGTSCDGTHEPLQRLSPRDDARVGVPRSAHPGRCLAVRVGESVAIGNRP